MGENQETFCLVFRIAGCTRSVPKQVKNVVISHQKEPKTRKSTENGPQNHARPKSRPPDLPKRPKCAPKVPQRAKRGTQGIPRGVEKSTKSVKKSIQKLTCFPTPLQRRFWVDFRWKLGGNWRQKRFKIGPRTEKSIFTECVFRTRLRSRNEGSALPKSIKIH